MNNIIDSNNRIESLQIIRAFAAVFVVICHIWNDGWLPAKFVNFGTFGVDLFFVLSGFIMCLTVKLNLGSKYLNAAYFLNKRVVRIFPIYILCMIPILLFNIKAEGLKGVFFYIGNVLLLPSFNNDAHYLMVLGPAWTLVYEMVFYYIFTFFILLTIRKDRLLFFSALFIFCLVFIVNILGISGGQLGWVNGSYLIGDPLLFNFVLGIVCYYIYSKIKNIVRFKASLSLMLLVMLSILAAYLNTFLPRIVACGLPAFIIVCLFTLTTNDFNKNRVLKKIVFIGDASYSIYLTHFYFAVFFKPRVLHLAGYTHVSFDGLLDIVDICLVVGAVFCGCLFYLFIEKPIIHYISRKRSEKVVG